MTKSRYDTVNVYSPVEDKKVKTNLGASLIWKKASTEEEYKENPRRYPTWYKYTFKFDGTKIVMHTNTKKLVN